ncbi:MAG: Rieske 2Fe-2S domain-containing protein [Myxococcales bacterium]|nr:Rieske 2Fe-2S domain-containing protein [Polyangiaceae bacterium]MDW8250013.1 Rieske 2Fe-2S domain-containing protein [Myxococcales bacterium]
MIVAFRRILLGPVAFLPPRGFVVVPVIPPHRLPDGTTARSALVGWAGSELRGYANVCRHQAIPLDLGDGAVMTPDGKHLLCHHHGAVFEPLEGRCILGPCLGMRLWTWSVQIDALGDATLIVGGETASEDV